MRRSYVQNLRSALDTRPTVPDPVHLTWCAVIRQAMVDLEFQVKANNPGEGKKVRSSARDFFEKKGESLDVICMAINLPADAVRRSVVGYRTPERLRCKDGSGRRKNSAAAV
jgi:hypothetical protein